MAAGTPTPTAPSPARWNSKNKAPTSSISAPNPRARARPAFRQPKSCGARTVEINKTRWAIDPGRGSGNRKEQTSLIPGRFFVLAASALPVMVGPSRKQFLAHATPEETRFATAAAVTAAILGGAHIL